MVTIKEALAELGKNKKQYESLASKGEDARDIKDPVKNAAYGLYLTSQKSEDPQRFLSTLSPFYDSKIKFDWSPYSGVLGEVVPYTAEAMVYTTKNRGVALHELVHTLQNKQAKEYIDKGKRLTPFQREQGRSLFERANTLAKQDNISFPASNWNQFQDELKANIYDISRRYEEAGKDFTKSNEFKMLFPDEASQLYYYTQILPGTSVMYPGGSNFVTKRTIDKNKSYARQAMEYIEDLFSNPLMDDTTK
jgi:hypothetical protein